jgi:hypothetical protein
MPSSSGENGICGTTTVRNGINNEMMTGNPTAAVETSISAVRGLLVFIDGLRDGEGRTECGQLQRDVEQVRTR